MSEYDPRPQGASAAGRAGPTFRSLDDVRGPLGPYLKRPPINSFEISSAVQPVGTGVGWIYDATSGNFTDTVELSRAQGVKFNTLPFDITTY